MSSSSTIRSARDHITGLGDYAHRKATSTDILANEIMIANVISNLAIAEAISEAVKELELIARHLKDKL